MADKQSRDWKNIVLRNLIFYGNSLQSEPSASSTYLEHLISSIDRLEGAAYQEGRESVLKPPPTVIYVDPHHIFDATREIVGGPLEEMIKARALDMVQREREPTPPSASPAEAQAPTVSVYADDAVEEPPTPDIDYPF